MALLETRCAHTPGQPIARIADEPEHSPRVVVTARGGECEEGSRNRVVARHTATVRVHPPEPELALGIAGPRRLTIKRGRQLRILGDALAVLIRDPTSDAVARGRCGDLGVRKAGRAERGHEREYRCVPITPHR